MLNIPCNASLALFTRYKLTRVRPGLKLTPVSFCRVNTANTGSTRVSLEKCRVNTTWVSFNRVSLCRVNRAIESMKVSSNHILTIVAFKGVTVA